MPTQEHGPLQPSGPNIYDLLAATNPTATDPTDEAHFFNTVGVRRDKDRFGPELSNTQALAYLFLEAGKNGLQSLRDTHFPKVHLHAQFFWLNTPFVESQQGVKDIFLDNYAAVVIGAAILAITHSDNHRFPLGEFVDFHNSAIKDVMTNLEINDLASQQQPLLGKHEALSQEQWENIHRYTTYGQSPILSSLPKKLRTLLPRSLQTILQRPPDLVPHIKKVYEAFREREEIFVGAAVIPEGYYDFNEDIGTEDARQAIPPAFLTLEGNLDPTSPEENGE